MTNITIRESIVLQYLSPLMEANAKMIGEQILRHPLNSGVNATAIGAIICGNLKKKGLVVRVSDLRAWRLSAAGRAFVKGTT